MKKLNDYRRDRPEPLDGLERALIVLDCYRDEITIFLCGLLIGWLVPR